MMGKRPAPSRGRPSERALRLYLAVSAAWLVAFPFLPSSVQPVAFMLVALGAIPPVAYGLMAVQPGRRRPWVLLLAALVVLNAGLFVRLGTPTQPFGISLNAAGNVLLLAAALALIVRCGRTDVGGVLDASIAGLAVGGLLWITVSGLRGAGAEGPVGRVNMFVVLVALSGVLGALVRLTTVTPQAVAALRWLLVGLGLALLGNVVHATFTGRWAEVLTGELFMAAYTAVGAFGLHPTAPMLVRPGFAAVDDRLTARRLIFLGGALATLPVVIGLRVVLHNSTGRDGAVLVVGGVLLATLVMLRIDRVAADRARVERVLQERAVADPLTGLLNRHAFLDRLTTELDQRRSSTVLFCDLDGFKAVNDQWGHGIGDAVLNQVAVRLAGSVRETDAVSRFGGDEFLILLASASQDTIDAVIERISAAFDPPFQIPTGSVRLGVSIGVATADHGSADQLVRRADQQMYRAKRSRDKRPNARVAA